MDVCLRRPLVVTCSTDKSVRAWNWANPTNRRCEIVKYFNEEAHWY